MEFLYLVGFVAGLSHVGVNGRAVNISSTWFLPQEGFPVFYRFFNEKVTWNEAEAICAFHHADLLSVQTSSQMDAAKAYLKEIDVTDNVWIGLQKESPEKPFLWSNDEKLLGDGYWIEPIPKTNKQLCAAIDPISDFRWNSFYCRGPQLASFVCELPVPEWAIKENGCLITSLPSLTVTFIPEMEAIQLLSDCGLDGTRRTACNGRENREEIIKRLSCDVDAFASTMFTTDMAREINTQQSSGPDVSNQINRRETMKIFSAHTRHRRSPGSISTNTLNTPSQTAAGLPAKGKKAALAAFSNIPSHGFPHSPYLASVRNAPSTKRPQTVRSKPRKSPQPPQPSYSTPNPFKDLPVLIITGEKLNESASLTTSENPQIVLMIENKDLNEPFLVPLSGGMFVDPSLSPVEVINVDLVEVDNLTVNATTNQTTLLEETPVVVRPWKLVNAKPNGQTKPEAEDTTEESMNALDDKGVDVPQRPNRGRLLTHSNYPSFYPRFLNRVLG